MIVKASSQEYSAVGGAPTIRFASGPSRNPASVPVENVYFTFASGRLTYDCVSCGAKCCRGHGYLATPQPELAHQLQMRKTLALFVSPAPDSAVGLLRVANCAPGCFFLSDNGQCEIHVARGYHAKPETCRLFPFNWLRRVGPYLVVSPHPSLCPLAIAAQPSDTSNHDALLRDLTLRPLAGVSAECPVADIARVQRVIEAERRIVDASERFLSISDYVEFACEQARITQDVCGSGGWLAVPSIARRQLEQLCQILGIECPSAANRSLIETVVAATPTLRSQYLFPESTSPRANGGVAYGDVTVAMLVLYAVATAAQTAGMKDITFQTLSRLDQEFRPVIELLMGARRPLVWRKDAPIPVESFNTAEDRQRFLGIAQALTPVAQRKKRLALLDILRDNLPSTQLDRVLFLKAVARQVAGNVTTLEKERQSRHPGHLHKRASDALLRLTLYYVDSSVLATVYERRSPLPRIASAPAVQPVDRAPAG